MDKDVLEIGQIFVEEYRRTSLDEILKEAIPDDNSKLVELPKFPNLAWFSKLR